MSREGFRLRVGPCRGTWDTEQGKGRSRRVGRDRRRQVTNAPTLGPGRFAAPALRCFRPTPGLCSWRCRKTTRSTASSRVGASNIRCRDASPVAFANAAAWLVHRPVGSASAALGWTIRLGGNILASIFFYISIFVTGTGGVVLLGASAGLLAAGMYLERSLIARALAEHERLAADRMG